MGQTKCKKNQWQTNRRSDAQTTEYIFNCFIKGINCLLAATNAACQPDSSYSFETKLENNLVLFAPHGKVDPKHEQFYNHFVRVDIAKSKKICFATKNQSNEEWHEERKKRITASQAYGLFTYMQNQDPDWTKKITKITKITPTTQAPAVQYGISTEAFARKCYSKQTGYHVEQMGFIINPIAPWLGFSPDGYIFQRDALIEIKCPFLGNSMNENKVLATLNYLSKNGDSYELKKRHQYYCQVQIGMAVTNCTKCDFVIYNKFEDRCYVILIELDYDFLFPVLATLETIYFNYFLPIIHGV